MNMKAPEYKAVQVDVIKSNERFVDMVINVKMNNIVDKAIFMESGNVFFESKNLSPDFKVKDVRRQVFHFVENCLDYYPNVMCATTLIRCGKTNALVGSVAVTPGEIRLFASTESLLYALSDFIKQFTAVTPVLIDRLMGFGDRGPVYDELTFDTTSSPLGLDVFYPGIKDGVAAYVKRFYESPASVLMIYGPPGTGKSSLIRNFFADDISIRLVDNPNLIKNDRFGEIFTSGSSASSNKPRLTVFEDADSYLGMRSDGNHFLAPLLNITEGVVKTRDKFIISTNLTSTAKIDPALIRHGRCFDVLHLEPLDSSYGNEVRTAVGKDVVLFKESKVTLSQALHYDQIAEKDHSERQAMGFN